jgi:hypothetical protein
MHLVSLVISGQGIHHDIDAGADREFMLAVGAGDGCVERLAIVVFGPGCCVIIGADDD